jgi:hypothetical protein
MLHVIMVAYERYVPLEIAIRSFLVQTDQRWVLHIIYDGPAPQGILDIVQPLMKDARVKFYQTPVRNGKYGHPNRRAMLQEIVCDERDFILLTNDDNYYVPRFVELMLREAIVKIGLVYCNTVHSHWEYGVNNSELRENFIDIGAFIVRSDIAKATGFNHDHFSADGRYAEDCADTCRRKGLKTVKINKPLFIHN